MSALQISPETEMSRPEEDFCRLTTFGVGCFQEHLHAGYTGFVVSDAPGSLLPLRDDIVIPSQQGFVVGERIQQLRARGVKLDVQRHCLSMYGELRVGPTPQLTLSSSLLHKSVPVAQAVAEAEGGQTMYRQEGAAFVALLCLLERQSPHQNGALRLVGVPSQISLGQDVLEVRIEKAYPAFSLSKPFIIHPWHGQAYWHLYVNPMGLSHATIYADSVLLHSLRTSEV